MATAEFSATIGSVVASASVSGGQASATVLIAAADTAVGTVVTDLTTSFTALDTAGDAIVAITGDTYSHTTHQFTFGGATGLTHAQWATNGALLNTAFNDFLTAQTDNTAAKAATAAAVAGGTLSSDVVVFIGNVSNVGDMNKLRQALRAIEDAIAGSGILATGSPTPRQPRPNG